MTMQHQCWGPFSLKTLLEDSSLKNPAIIGCGDLQKVKKEDASDIPHLNYGPVFLGPTLWDRSLNNEEFNLEYMDLDEFLSENGIPTGSDEVLNNVLAVPGKKEDSSCSLNVIKSLPASPVQFPHSPRQHLNSNSSSSPTQYCASVKQQNSNKPMSPVSPFSLEYQVTDQELALTSLPGEQSFDPRKRNFTEEELKPQPVIKKSKKIYVPDDMKDEKYWARRHKNNFAARRSRDARRLKENQIAMRAAYLEKENSCLREEVTKLRKENARLKVTMAKYEGILPSVSDVSLPQ